MVFWAGWKITAYQYGIFADYLNIAPVYYKIVLPTEQAEALATPENYYAAYLGGAGVELNIVHKADTAARFYTDYLFTP